MEEWLACFQAFILGQNILALVKLSLLPMTTLTSIGHINTKSESDVSQVLWILQSLTSVQLNSYGRFRIYVTALSSTIIKISNIKWIWFWKKIFQHSSRASETWTINAKVHWNSRWWILFNPEVWRSWQAREQCTTSTSFATHIIPDSFICDFLNRRKKNEITREKLQQIFFLTKGKRQKHLSGTIFLTSIPPHSLNLLSSQVIPANYPADVFGKIKESNQSNRDESAFSVRPVPRQGAVYEKDSFFPSRAETTQKSSQQWCRVIPSNSRKGGHVFII